MRLSATSSRKTSDESLNLKNLGGGSGDPVVVEVWLRVVGEIGRLVGDAAESFDGISDDRVSD